VLEENQSLVSLFSALWELMEIHGKVMKPWQKNFIKQGVSHIVALPFTLKSDSRQKKIDGNSNISPCKNLTKTKILQDIITL
jgi:hypothetical protein